MTKRIMLVFGTRPEAIKMAPVYRALRARPGVFEVSCCVTAQHREMLDQALRIFGITPEIDLDLMRHGQDLSAINAAVLMALSSVLQDARPDLVLVHGDTTTSMATALAAYYAGIKVGHVEAGLRSHDLQAPFPEEANRRITAVLAKYHFAPTEMSRQNLLSEGCSPASVTVTGNTVVDALTFILRRIDSERKFRTQVENELDMSLGFNWRTTRFVIVTAHRRENLSNGLQNICAALGKLSAAFPDVHFVYPVHCNARVREPVAALLAGLANVHLIEPLGYDAFVHALNLCHMVMTDSGGLQEEAPVLGKPVLVMRDVTERPEALEVGAARLVGANCANLVSGVSELLTDPAAYRRMAATAHPFGDGAAGERIAAFLERSGI